MKDKRYAIVRVDKFCPRDLERNYKLKCIGSLRCDKCEIKKKYGDTKEQLIKKVAQVFFRRKLKVYKKVLGGEFLSKKDLKRIYEKCLEVAKEIVEFLGVE